MISVLIKGKLETGHRESAVGRLEIRCHEPRIDLPGRKRGGGQGAGLGQTDPPRSLQGSVALLTP